MQHCSRDQRGESNSYNQLDLKANTYSELPPRTSQDHSSGDQRGESNSYNQLDLKANTYSELSPGTIQDHSSRDQRGESNSYNQLDLKANTYSVLSPGTIQDQNLIDQEVSNSCNQSDSITVNSYGVIWGKTKRVRIPSHVQHLVWLRDQGQCAYHNSDRDRCSAARMLEIDHRIPVARGGTNDLSNLSLHCRLHNFYQAELLMGKERMGQYQRTAHPK